MKRRKDEKRKIKRAQDQCKGKALQLTLHLTLQFLQTSPFPPTKTSIANDAEDTEEKAKGAFTNFTDT